MCDPVSIGTALATVAVSQAMAPKPPSMPTPKEPAPPPQAAQLPEQRAVRASQAAASPAGPSAARQGTMLTGMGGVDPTTLNLGKNVLLGA